MGGTVNISKRWSRHRTDLAQDIHGNRHLQNAWTAHGPDAFDWEILELCSRDVLLEREQYWLDHYDSADPDRGFNIATLAGSNAGLKFPDLWTDQRRQDASEAWKKRRPAGWTPTGMIDVSVGSLCPEGHVRDGSYMKRRKNGSVMLLCQECERKKARERERRKRGVPLDWPEGKHYNRRGR